MTSLYRSGSRHDTMPFDERDKIILAIICIVVGCIFVVIIICFVVWFLLRRYRAKPKEKSTGDDLHASPIATCHRQQYQRSQRFPWMKSSAMPNNSNKIKSKHKRRFISNPSKIILPFDPPHLINQNVRNLDKLLNNESTLTANSWHYEETFPTRYCHHTAVSTEPVYASSSTVLTSVSNLAITSLPPSHPNIHFLTELDHVLRSKHDARPKPPLRHSQSCRQTNDWLPFDYYRSSASPSTITGTSSSNANSLEPIYNCTNKYSNTTLARKARLGHLRDDTAILY